MIKFQRITTKDATLYNYMEQLVTVSLPSEECRPLEELHNCTDTETHFYCNTILHHDTPVGFIAYWDLGHFYYVEHFAIDPSLCSGGHGKNILNHLCQQLNKPIILEVGMPGEETAIRRTNFYKRRGFTLRKKPYMQPPYKVGDNYLPMLLMTHGNLECEKDFERVKKCICREVYKAK